MRRFEEVYGLPPYEANLLTESRARADYFERAVACGGERLDASRAMPKKSQLDDR